MNIAVCVKETPATLEDLTITEQGTLDEKYLSYNINQWDSCALEKAVQLKEEQGASVYVVNISSEKNEKMLKKCLARGADQAIMIYDESFQENDPHTSAKILAKVLKEIAPDLILTGLQSDDTNYCMVGGTIAELLTLPFASLVYDFDLENGSNNAIVKQRLEGGILKQVKIEIPAVLAVDTGIAEPMPPTMMAIRKTKGVEIDIRTIGELHLREGEVGNEASQITVKRYKEPPSPEAAEILKDGPEETSKQVVDILVEKGLR